MPEDIEKKRARHRKWTAAHPAAARLSRRKYHQGLRLKVLGHYGNKCECCGEDEPCFLGIDHINNDGAHQRKTNGSGQNFYRWIIKMGFPTDLQILCHNCNLAKGFYGQCPHEENKDELSTRS